MPSHDQAPRRSAAERSRFIRERAESRRLIARIKRRLGLRRRDGKDEDEGGEGVPVDPTRPGTLDGGAAAALEFDD